MTPFQCIGHRGAAGHAPENTLLSVRRAFSLGARAVEVDVRAVGGELLVLHDETLERTTGAKGRIQDWKVSALRRLDAGQGERIPFLREVWRALPPGATLYAEIKGGGVPELLAEFLRDPVPGASEAPLSRTVVSCFHPGELRRLRKLEPRARLGLLYERCPDDLDSIAAELRPESLHVSLSRLEREEVARAHALGLRCLVYTVNDRPGVERVLDAGADGVFSDYPERIRSYLSEIPLDLD